MGATLGDFLANKHVQQLHAKISVRHVYTCNLKLKKCHAAAGSESPGSAAVPS